MNSIANISVVAWSATVPPYPPTDMVAAVTMAPEHLGIDLSTGRSTAGSPTTPTPGCGRTPPSTTTRPMTCGRRPATPAVKHASVDTESFSSAGIRLEVPSAADDDRLRQWQ